MKPKGGHRNGKFFYTCDPLHCRRCVTLSSYEVWFPHRKALMWQTTAFMALLSVLDHVCEHSEVLQVHDVILVFLEALNIVYCGGLLGMKDNLQINVTGKYYLMCAPQSLWQSTIYWMTSTHWHHKIHYCSQLHCKFNAVQYDFFFPVYDVCWDFVIGQCSWGYTSAMCTGLSCNTAPSDYSHFLKYMVKLKNKYFCEDMGSGHSSTCVAGGLIQMLYIAKLHLRFPSNLKRSETFFSS